MSELTTISTNDMFIKIGKQALMIERLEIELDRKNTLITQLNAKLDKPEKNKKQP